jgi:hypothetical protein
MKIIFKIIEYLSETEQIVVKFCRQNAPKPIDEYVPVAIDCRYLDTSDRVNLIESLFQLGMNVISQQEEQEETLPENISSEIFFESSFEHFIDKIIVTDTKELQNVKSKRMKRIDIE